MLCVSWDICCVLAGIHVNDSGYMLCVSWVICCVLIGIYVVC